MTSSVKVPRFTHSEPPEALLPKLVKEGKFNLPHAPIYKPSIKEFSDPWSFVLSIQDTLDKTGIAIIEPPEGYWKPEIWREVIDADQFIFSTKVQHVNRLMHRYGPNVRFLSLLKSYYSVKGVKTEVFDNVKVDGRNVDFFMLYSSVSERGTVCGYVRVNIRVMKLGAMFVRI